MKGSCCPEWTACDADANCVCWRDCMEDPQNNPGICIQPNKCGNPEATATAFATCGVAQCASDCPQFEE
jgi:hypothetical protein